MMMLAGLASAAGTGVSAVGAAAAAEDQADADQRRADIEAKWTERRAGEERAAAQRASTEEMRKAQLAQSRLTAVAGASGTSPTDQGVMDLYGDIEKEGRLNAGNAMAAGEQRGAGMEYQAALGRWTADANARIKKGSVIPTLLGGALHAGGQFADGFSKSRMAERYSSDYGNGARGGGYGTGYGVCVAVVGGNYCVYLSFNNI
jgi:hypothetical protein